jgi:hypothetical protein
MHALIVEYDLQGITPEEYEAHCERLADAFNSVPGLVSKTWIFDRRSNRAGGMYVFAGEDAADDYLDGPEFEVLVADPRFANVRVRRLDVLDAPTAVTHEGALSGLPPLRLAA